MDRSLSKFEALHGLRHRNLVSSAAQCLDTYRSWPAGHFFFLLSSPGLAVIPLGAGVAGYLPFLGHRNPCLKVGVEKGELSFDFLTLESWKDDVMGGRITWDLFMG